MKWMHCGMKLSMRFKINPESFRGKFKVNLTIGILTIFVFLSCQSQKTENCMPVENGFVDRVGPFKHNKINSIVIHSNEKSAEVKNLFEGEVVAMNNKYGSFVTIKSDTGLAIQYALLDINEYLKLNTKVAKGELIGNFNDNIEGPGFVRLSFKNVGEAFYNEFIECLINTSSKSDLKKYLKLQKEYESYKYGNEFDN